QPIMPRSQKPAAKHQSEPEQASTSAARKIRANALPLNRLQDRSIVRRRTRRRLLDPNHHPTATDPKVPFRRPRASDSRESGRSVPARLSLSSSGNVSGVTAGLVGENWDIRTIAPGRTTVSEFAGTGWTGLVY
ncbi:hypothetical protein ACIRRA_45235, partial [Nocardia sp. NPDC101769]|uniref:hypothetical protein n=1 Tax=Nocardia sp. NPDC101769 TaxID=3364333 RepID=UPI00381D5D7E